MLGLGATSRGGHVGVRPLELTLRAKPGAAIPFQFEAFSTSPTEATELALRLADAVPARDGELSFGEPGTYQYSCAGWVRLEAKGVTVRGGGRQFIRGELRVPDDAETGVYLAAVMARVVEPRPAAGLAFVVRYALRLRVAVQSRRVAAPEVDVGEASVRRTREALEVVALAENRGAVPAEIEATAEILGPDRRILERVPLASKAARTHGWATSRLHPAATVELVGELKRPIEPGDHTVRVSGRYGGGRRLHATRVVRIESPLTPAGMIAAGEGGTRFLVEPDVLAIEAPPGSFRRAVLSLRNPGPQPIELALRLESVGGSGYPFSCTGWATLSSGRVAVPPGTGRRVAVSVRVPRGAAPAGYYGRLLVAPAGADGGQTPVSVALRALVPGATATARLRIDGLRALPPLPASETMEVEVANVGTLAAQPSGRLTILGAEGRALGTARLTLPDETLYPGLTATMVARFKGNLAAGTYTLVSDVFAGKGASATRRFQVVRTPGEVPPWPDASPPPRIGQRPGAHGLRPGAGDADTPPTEGADHASTRTF
jgi:hypothetical protein